MYEILAVAQESASQLANLSVIDLLVILEHFIVKAAGTFENLVAFAFFAALAQIRALWAADFGARFPERGERLRGNAANLRLALVVKYRAIFLVENVAKSLAIFFAHPGDNLHHLAYVELAIVVGEILAILRTDPDHGNNCQK